MLGTNHPVMQHHIPEEQILQPVTYYSIPFSIQFSLKTAAVMKNADRGSQEIVTSSQTPH
jgi:hypothetical protein